LLLDPWTLFETLSSSTNLATFAVIAHPSIAAARVLRTHSETVLLLALAAASTRFRSSGLKRTGTMLSLASPFASLGRPGLLAFFGMAFGLLQDFDLLFRVGVFSIKPSLI
jgi:hypothetical protein